MQNYKAQVTVFAILGIVILFILGYTLFTLSSLKAQNLQPQSELSAEAILKASTMDEYARLCLRESMREGLELVGEQGGVIYDFQASGTGIQLAPHNTSDFSQSYSVLNGTCQSPYRGEYRYNHTFILPFEHNFSSTNPVLYNVSYAILRKDRKFPTPSLCQDTFAGVHLPPGYPYSGTLNENSIQESLGSTILRDLCNKFGENAWNLSSVLNVSQEWLNRTCEGSYSNDYTPLERSMQEMLRIYVENVTDECLDPSAIRTNLNFDVQKGDVEASVVLGREDITAFVRFPLRFSFGEDKSVTKMLSFSHTEKIRFREIVLAAQRLITEENKNIFFDIDYDPAVGNCTLFNNSKRQCLLEGMSLANFTKPCFENELCISGNHSDVWVLTDNKSMLYDQPYRFIFAVENRYPALDYIDAPASGGGVNLVAFENQTLVIDPYAYDPDQDRYASMTHPVTGKRFMESKYRYSGWKETEDAYFNFTGCQENHADCLINPRKYTVTFANSPYNWTNSAAYSETFRNATYHTSKNDTGLHIVEVTVCDDERLCDSQEIRILVIDSPTAVANGTNRMESLPHKYASIEDPYYISANDSISSVLTGISINYTWYDLYYNPILLLNSSEDPSIAIEIPLQNYTIQNITSHYFNQTDIDLTNLPASHPLKLEIVTPSRTVYDVLSVNVYQCLPYHESSAAPFPYHNFTLDDDVVSYANVQNPFFANHTCCKKDPYGTVSPSGSRKCYEYASYGGLNATQPGMFASLGSAAYTSQPLIVETYTLGSLSITKNTQPGVGMYEKLLAAGISDNDINDIYMRNYTRLCDGTRGNMCNGTIIEKILPVRDCDNLNTNLNQVEHCSGPSIIIWENETSVMPECVNYENDGVETTFEAAVLGTGSGVCAPPTCVGDEGEGKSNICSGGACTTEVAKTCKEDCGAHVSCEGVKKNQVSGGICCSKCNALSQITVPNFGIVDTINCDFYGAGQYCKIGNLFFEVSCSGAGWDVVPGLECTDGLEFEDVCAYPNPNIEDVCFAVQGDPETHECTSSGWELMIP